MKRFFMGGAALLLLGLSCLLTSCDNAGDDAYLYKKVTTTSTTTPLPGEGGTPGGMGKPSDGNPNGNPDPHGNGVSHDFYAF